jgi:hypothetical protein
MFPLQASRCDVERNLLQAFSFAFLRYIFVREGNELLPFMNVVAENAELQCFGYKTKKYQVDVYSFPKKVM